MSNPQTKTQSPKTCLIAGLFSCLIAALVPFSLAEAFQIRQADSLRVMQSKPYAQSANFRVNADMFIQPSAKINVDETVASAPAPVVVTPSVTPSAPVVSNGGGSGGGGQRYSADNWLLSRKYDELVRERDEADEPFLTSAPEDPDLKFDYIPTRPGEVIPVLPAVDPAPTPEVAPTKTLISAFKAVVLPTPAREESPERVVIVDRPEAALLSAPIGPDVTVVSLNTRQKQKLLTASDSKFAWLWGAEEVTEESWQAAAPKEVAAPTCVGCADVLWMKWCVFVALCLLLILIFVILIFVMQIMVLRLRADRHKPDNPRTLKYRMKKLFKQFGLLALVLCALNVTTYAQTTTPQTLIYEGELLDDAGVPVLGSYTFRFSFWDNGDYEATDVAAGVINGGATDFRGWTEVQTVSTLSDGSFSMLLSEVTPFTAGLFDQDNIYLQVEVKSAGDADTAYEFVDINLTDPTDDRKIIASVPFAFNANKLDYRDLGFGAGNIPYLDLAGLLPESLIPDLNLTSSDLDLADITLSDFTNDLALNDGQIFVGDAANVATGVAVSGDATMDNTGAFTITTDAVGDDEIDYGNVTLADFTNDVGFVTTDTLGGLACAANEIAKWDGSAWICSPDAGGSAYTASDGITLTGSNFTNDFGTTIEGSEITDGTIGGADLNFGDITLADFTNDAGFLTTVDISDDTNLTAGAGATLTDDEISVNVGDTIETSEITDGTILGADLNLTDITLTDFTNDAGFITADTLDGLSCALNEVAKWDGSAWICAADTGTTYTAGTGLTLVGTEFSNNLGDTIEESEIADNAVTLAKIGTAGAVDGDKILTTDGAGDPQWEDKSNFLSTTLTAGQLIVGNGANVATGVSLTGDATLDETGALSLTADAVKDDEIDYASVTLSDFTNDAGFITTDTDTTYSAGIGMNLVGTTFSSTLGTDIDSSEIADGSVSEADINFGDVTLADFTNDAGFLTTVDISANTNLVAGDGVTLTGDTLSADLGTSIVSGEITDGTVAEVDLNLTDITLADFTNDAGFVTTDTDTTYTAGTGLNLVGTTFSSALGTSIDATEIETNAVADDEIDYTNVTLNDFTNDAGFLTTVDISSNTNLAAGSGIMLVGDSILSSLGDDIVSGEIVDGTIGDADLNLADITLADFTNDAGFLTSEIDGSTTNEIQDLTLAGNTLSLSGDATTVDLTAYLDDTDTTYTAGSGLTLVGTTFSADLGNIIDAAEIDTNAVGDDEIDYANVTLNDFTNDAGFLTAEAQDLSLLGADLSITGGSTIDLSTINTDTLDGLTCGVGEVAKWNGSAWVCAPDSGGSSYTASDGITLTGSNFTNDFGNSIESNEITNGTIGDQDLDLADITLTDFTNDAGFLTTDSDTLDSLACAADEIARFNGTVWECAGGPTSVTEVLGVRSASLIFDADGTNNTGSMYEEEATTLSGILDNVLRWFSRQTVLHDYDIIVQWTVPTDFDSFEPNPISLDYQTDGAVTDAVIDMTVKHNTDADDELVGTGIGLNSNTWATTNFNIDGTTTWLPGETMKIRLKMNAKDSNSAQIGNIKIKYKRK